MITRRETWFYTSFGVLLLHVMVSVTWEHTFDAIWYGGLFLFSHYLWNKIPRYKV